MTVRRRVLSFYFLLCSWEKEDSKVPTAWCNVTWRDVTKWTHTKHPMVGQCWAIVVDGGPALTQQFINALCCLESCVFDIITYCSDVYHIHCAGFKLPAWKVRDCLRPQAARAQISNSVSGGQCHLIHLTILRGFSWPSLAYMCTKVA